jgi:6-phosphogluconolactonase
MATAPDLRVLDDVAAGAVDMFLEEAPRIVLLTGGQTARTFYERLAKADYPWEDVECYFTDERCVPPSDPLSNFGMADEALLSEVPAARYPIDGDTCDADGYEDLLRRQFPDGVRFDLAVYGLGPDGHVASLFPGKPEVAVTDRLAVEVPEAGWEPFVRRVSLTLPALSSAALGMFVVAGEGKREALARLLRGEDIPAAEVRPGRLIVLADRAAAG